MPPRGAPGARGGGGGGGPRGAGRGVRGGGRGAPPPALSSSVSTSGEQSDNSVWHPMSNMSMSFSTCNYDWRQATRLRDCRATDED